MAVNKGSCSDQSLKGSDGNCPSDPPPKFPCQLYRKKQDQKKKNKKNSIQAKIVNGEIVVRIMLDDMPFFLYENQFHKKIYHAPEFGVVLPDHLDLEYVKSLPTKERLKYLSDPSVLPPKCVADYLKKLSKHVLDPNTQIKVGTLGERGVATGWDATDPIPGTHTFNPMTGNDAQVADLEDNNNIL